MIEIIIDQQEKKPFSFAGCKLTRPTGHKGPPQHTLVVDHLHTGDYSIRGYENVISIERKSFNDLYQTLGKERARFVRELERLSKMPFALVVVEAPWEKILGGHPKSKLNPKTIWHSVIAWRMRYPTVHWEMCMSREVAEKLTFRTLDRFWRDKWSENFRKEQENKG